MSERVADAGHVGGRDRREKARRAAQAQAAALQASSDSNPGENAGSALVEPSVEPSVELSVELCVEPLWSSLWSPSALAGASGHPPSVSRWRAVPTGFEVSSPSGASVRAQNKVSMVSARKKGIDTKKQRLG